MTYWTAEETAYLKRLAKRENSWKAVALALGRSRGSVRYKAYVMGLTIKPEPKWSDARSVRHRQLYDEGRSHAVIGRILTKEFGIEVSRNASIGRAHREGYPPRASAGGATTGRSRKRSRPCRPPRPDKQRVLKEPEPMPTNITLLELTDHVCKWPVSGEKADTRFCGAHAEPGKSYCKHHQGRSVSVVYTPLKGKRAANYGAWLSRIGTGKPASIDVAEFWEAANG